MANWVDIDIQTPDAGKLYLVNGEDGEIFLAEWVESKWGHYFTSTDWSHGEFHSTPSVTHWMLLPDSPKYFKISKEEREWLDSIQSNDFGQGACVQVPKWLDLNRATELLSHKKPHHE